ncbi:conserved exported protein of unknown function [Pseudodesulfovibrio profundus]|uniref:Tetratricopeptide TPR_2 repeat protein n=1 Tax=Pseudodesulfovibrio profundus TaxID=57320 RepID=A0A2C8F5H7_9BACT|nr:conserved exported protein of unknown function [Pseudodesulfovibrio profundus]
MKNAIKMIQPWVLALIMGMLAASPALALRVNFSSQGDSDRLIFAFDSKQLPEFEVSRVGERELNISLPNGIWDSETKPTSKDFPGKLVESLRTTENGVELVTRTNAFGYINVATPGKPEFLLQIFRDPIGARWKAPVERQETVAPEADTPAENVTETEPVTAPEPQPAAPQNTAPQVQPAPQPAQPQAQGNGEGQRQPFFAVPYSVRNEVQAPGQASEPVSGATADPAPVQEEPVEPVAPQEPEVTYPPSSELRFKVSDSTPEEAGFAELAEESILDSTPAPSEQRGTVGAVTPPVDNGDIAEVQEPASGSGAAGGSVAPPPGSTAASAPTVSGQGQAGGTVSPPPSVVEGAPPPEPTAEEEALVQQTMENPTEQLSVQEQIALQEGGEGTPVPEEPVAAAEEELQAEADTAQEGEPQTQEQLDQAIRDKLYEAQSMMFSGALDNALPMFEDILKQPNIPDDVREETLFAVADIKKEMFKDQLDEKFSEITQAYIEAMNANPRSNRVPRSLLNLGLLNLRMGNFPEAKAYFKILQDKYPDDENIPSISYYWGEYYYNKGDYKKAADQFQYLIQTHPEHELVKQAAYYLADSLNKTGFVEQAFQIVDYIDKRWPDYYMENPQFLRLAGGVEMKLEKWPQAKNHFFTYYNINPEADGADLVLARIGDIYVRQGENDAARQVYQKAIKDFPDKDGGLISKMRLAEEGIYDEPAMAEMASVFDRPYNKRPENIYKEIVENHPDSPLAPIAQLKLAMWYAFNEQYPEALTAAQDFVDLYPEHQLVDRARTLGDSVFALAVPGMIEEERYGRIVRYWETYDFIGQEDTKVDDQTRLNVATSYWKVGQPEKALEIIKPFLQDKQIPGISDEALGLAVNIYLDDLAWQEIADLVAMAKKNWDLKPAQLRQLDYARAMSLQNLGQDNQAQAMWAELAKDMDVEPAFRAYAMYYMAKAAMERQDLRRVFVYAQEALTLLLQNDGDPEKIKDAVLMSIYATERSGRYEEALKWAKQYDEYISVDNPEWASTRFKLARIYRKAGAMEEWKQLLTDIIEKKPDSLQAQLAKSALDTYDLEQQVQQYQPGPR